MKKTIFLYTLILTTVTFFSFTTITDTKAPKVATINYYEQDLQLKELITSIEKQDKVAIIYFYADWCGPCKRFKKSFKSNLVKEALANAVFIKINVDEDVEKQGVHANYGINVIPTFIKTNPNADVIAEITSDEWDEDIPENISKVMNSFINTDTYHK
ncbi:thioredoxin family protein [uncultured Dokdonia sp.]|uniref:thioredoxin family protein n=1 Tax=uncultured Dokdonia sp. TaxID=575653 RepID=UPI0026072C3C|nr:thioredoxin family protein [uncultured Dokdonia sp.]